MICDGVSILNVFRDICKLLNNDCPKYDYSVEMLRKELLPRPVIGCLGLLYIKKQNRIWENVRIERAMENMDKIIGAYLKQKAFRIHDFVINQDESIQAVDGKKEQRKC
jgi:hypothetical protein